MSLHPVQNGLVIPHAVDVGNPTRGLLVDYGAVTFTTTETSATITTKLKNIIGYTVNANNADALATNDAEKYRLRIPIGGTTASTTTAYNTTTVTRAASGISGLKVNYILFGFADQDND